MNTHWTSKSIDKFRFRIAADFITQLEDRIEELEISQTALAHKLGVSKSRVSQVLNNPGNIELNTIVEYARTLGMKVSIVAYDDNDPNNEKGPINPEIFKISWERANKPRDFWSIEQKQSSSGQLQYIDLPPLAKAVDDKAGLEQEETDKTISPSVAMSELALASNY